MIISEQWLRTWVNPNATTEALSHKLTMIGLEVDSIDAAAEEDAGDGGERREASRGDDALDGPDLEVGKVLAREEAGKVLLDGRLRRGALPSSRQCHGLRTDLALLSSAVGCL